MSAGPAGGASAVYKLDRLEKAVLRKPGESYPESMTTDELAAALGRSAGVLTYKSRMLGRGL